MEAWRIRQPKPSLTRIARPPHPGQRGLDTTLRAAFGNGPATLSFPPSFCFLSPITHPNQAMPSFWLPLGRGVKFPEALGSSVMSRLFLCVYTPWSVFVPWWSTWGSSQWWPLLVLLKISKPDVPVPSPSSSSSSYLLLNSIQIFFNSRLNHKSSCTLNCKGSKRWLDLHFLAQAYDYYKGLFCSCQVVPYSSRNSSTQFTGVIFASLWQSLVLAESGHRMAMYVWSQTDVLLSWLEVQDEGWSWKLDAGRRGERPQFFCALSTVFHSCYLGQTHCLLESTSLQEENSI